MGVHICTLSAQEAEEGWSWILGQPSLHRINIVHILKEFPAKSEMVLTGEKEFQKLDDAF